MKKQFINTYFFRKAFVVVFFFLLQGCSKDFLDKKPNSNIVQPNTLEDLQGLLDNFEVLNSNYPAIPQLACDDYYFISKTDWESTRTATERNNYIWAKDVYGGETGIYCWSGPYSTIFYANNILESAAKISATNDNKVMLRNIIGSAYFFRAYAYFELVKNFAKAYDETTAGSDLGVPLKLKAGINEVLPRSSVQDCYNQIITDLDKAKEFMNLTVPNPARNRPSRLAAYALLSRVYLSMRKYDMAYASSDSTLRNYNKLIDYNTVSTSASTPFSITNDETIFSTSLTLYNAITYRNTDRNLSVDTQLLASYKVNDLRKVIYFSLVTPGIYSVRRGYYGSGISPYNGLAVDEMYLIKAECAARLDKTDEAMELLNGLLKKRFKTGMYNNLTASTAADALGIILTERRKELVWRGLRWDDLKRLNKEGANISLKRNLDGQIYTLSPNTPRWVFNIPQDEINYSGITQNER